MKRFLLTTGLALVLATPVALAQTGGQGAPGAGGDAPASPVAPNSNTRPNGTPVIPEIVPGTVQSPAIGMGSAMKVDTQTFVQKAAMSNQFKIQTSELAVSKAQNDEVKSVARDMIKELQDTGRKLKTALDASRKDRDMSTASVLDARHQQIIENLGKVSGAEFDRLYIEAQINAHREAVDLFRAYSQTGDDSDLKSFASQTLPALERHLKQIQAITLRS